jgi:hypothetical protein
MDAREFSMWNDDQDYDYAAAWDPDEDELSAWYAAEVGAIGDPADDDETEQPEEQDTAPGRLRWISGRVFLWAGGPEIADAKWHLHTAFGSEGAGRTRCSRLIVPVQASRGTTELRPEQFCEVCGRDGLRVVSLLRSIGA